MKGEFCIYETRHPDGRYYRGKAKLANIARGYQGSGVRIKAALKKYPGQFTTRVLMAGLTNRTAYRMEALITHDLAGKDENKQRFDQLCLNLQRGGLGRQMEGETDYQISRADLISKTKKKQFQEDPAYRQSIIDRFARAKAANLEKARTVPFTVDGQPVAQTSEQFAQHVSLLAKNNLKLKKTGYKSYRTIDEGFYLGEERFTHLGHLKAAAAKKVERLGMFASVNAGMMLQELVKTGHRTYVLQQKERVQLDEMKFASVAAMRDWAKSLSTQEIVKVKTNTYTLQPKVRKSLGRPRKTAEIRMVAE